MSRLFKFTFLIVLILVFAVSPVMAQDDVVLDLSDGAEPTTWEIILTLLVVGFFVYEIGKMLFQRKSPADIDAHISARLDQVQRDREQMSVFERMFQKQSETIQAAIEVFGTVVTAVAPILPGEADSKFGEVLEDITVPGAPDDLTAHSSEALIASTRTMTAEDWGHWDKFLTWWPDSTKVACLKHLALWNRLLKMMIPRLISWRKVDLMSNRSLVILSVLLALILLVSLAIIASMAQDGDAGTTQAPISSLEPVVFRDAVMSIDDSVTHDVRFSGGVVQVDDYEHSLPLEWDAGFIADIDDVQYVVCPHGLNAEGLWWGYVVPTSNTTTIHCENDPEPLRITTVPSED